MFVKIVILVMVLLCSTVILGITFNCDTQKAQKGSDVTCTCTSSNNIEWQLNDIFFSTCTTTNICSPKPIGYIFQNDVSQTDKNYGLTVQSFDYSSCAEYSCTDTSTSEEKKIEISISDFDVSSVVASEPGANTNGSINVTTGCVFPPEDISVKWYKVQQNGDVEEIKANIPIPIFDRASCSRTCNSKEDKILTNGFTHTEYTNTDGVKVRYRVVLRLIPFPDLGDLFTWTTASEYRLKADCICECDCECRTIVIVSIVFGILGILGLLIIVVGIPAGCFNERETLLLASGVIGIVFDVLSLVLSIVVKVKECCECCEENCECCEEDSECCKDWIDNAAIAFIVIPCVVGLISVVIFVLVKLDIIGPGRNAYKAKEAKEPGENHGMTGTSM